MRFSDYGTAVADANGRAVIPLGPQRGNENWYLQTIAVSNDGAALPDARGYLGVESLSTLLVSFPNNLQAAQEFPEIHIPPGSRLVAVWAGATPGSTSTLTVHGILRRP